MIVYDLLCGSGGHVFEAWFGSSSDYDDQCARGLLSCPMCGSDEIGKAPMAPAVRPSGVVPDAKAMLAALAAAQAKALENSTWVGGRFVDEARAMHLGEVDHRPIHGQATLADARSLAEEGVPIAPLPLPVVPPEEAN
ncbi:DUF1178 family protein [Sphingomonas arenae]|uniref:DUF1178 family protein n=1 Tax=Sphingomonas arenae TaxID=2812555 RepID=UPI001968414E|nr:DUF1178 family protein [Sphingomonas arenae]